VAGGWAAAVVSTPAGVQIAFEGEAGDGDFDQGTIGEFTANG